MKPFALLLALAAAGCAVTPANIFAGSTPIEVREAGRSLFCNTPGDAPLVVLLPGAQAVVDWQAARGVTLAGSESLTTAPYAVVEMGVRPTGGYSLAVARSAALRGETVTLQATFFTPAPGSLRTQALSSPCVLVQLPPGRYAMVEVHDPSGAVHARGGLRAPPAPETPPPAQPEPPPPPEPAQ